MARQINRKWIADGAIDGTKIKLENGQGHNGLDSQGKVIEIFSRFHRKTTE